MNFGRSTSRGIICDSMEFDGIIMGFDGITQWDYVKFNGITRDYV